MPILVGVRWWCGVKWECGRRKREFSPTIAIIFRMKLPTGFTYRNLHGFAWLPGNSTALVLYAAGRCWTNSSSTSSYNSGQNYRTQVICQCNYTGSWSPVIIGSTIACNTDSAPGQIVDHQRASRSFTYIKTISWKNSADMTSFSCTVNGVDLHTTHELAHSSNLKHWICTINALRKFATSRPNYWFTEQRTDNDITHDIGPIASF